MTLTADPNDGKRFAPLSRLCILSWRCTRFVLPSGMAPREHLEFRVELWDRADVRLERLIAASDHLLVAKAAFREAARLMPTMRLYLRHRARVIEKQEPA
jgi:hypothetical protein